METDIIPKWNKVLAHMRNIIFYIENTLKKLLFRPKNILIKSENLIF